MGRRCRREQWVHFRTARRKPFRGYCPEHNIFSPHCRRADIFAALEAQGNRQDAEKGGQGRRRAFNAFDGSKFLAEVKRVIIVLSEEGLSNRHITGKLIASRMNLGSLETGSEILRQNLRKSGEHKRVSDFIDAVLAENVSVRKA